MSDFGLSEFFGSSAGGSAAATGAESAAATAADVGTADAGVGALAAESPIAQATITGAPSILGEGAATGITMDQIMNGVKTAGNILNTANSVGSLVKSAPPTAGVPQTAIPPASTQAVQPSSISPTDYTSSETARWQQLLANSGQSAPGGQLPQNISDMIARQATLVQ